MYIKGISFVEEEVILNEEEQAQSDSAILSQSMPLQRSLAIRKKSRDSAKELISKELQKELERKGHKNLVLKTELGKTIVLSGSKEALLLHLIFEQDEQYELEFFHTYRYLFKPEVILNTLTRHAVDLRSSLKVLNVLLPWFENASSDFTHDPELLKKLIQFVLSRYFAKKRITTSKKKVDVEDIDCIDDLTSFSSEFILSILKKKPFVKSSPVILASSVSKWIMETLYLSPKETSVVIDICQMAWRSGVFNNTHS